MRLLAARKRKIKYKPATDTQLPGPSKINTAKRRQSPTLEIGNDIDQPTNSAASVLQGKTNTKLPNVASSLILETRKCLDQMIPAEKNAFFKKMSEVLKPEEKQDLCYYLGSSECSTIFEDVTSISLQYKNVKLLSNINLFDWIMKRNKSVILFLLGLGIYKKDFFDIQSDTDGLLVLVRVIEQVYVSVL